MWPFKTTPEPTKPPREWKTKVETAYFPEYMAIVYEAEWEHFAQRGVGGAVEALAREIVALQARLDKLEGLVRRREA